MRKHPAEPEDGERHRNRHDLAEDVHPGPRPREHSRPAGEDAEQKPRKRHAQTEREEDGDRLDGGLRHGVAQSGAHEGGRAGAGDDDGEDAREERAHGTGSRRAARNAGVGEMACGSEFKDAKQVDRDGDEEHEQERDDPRTLELEAPTERHAHAPEGEKRTRQHTHRDEDAAREGDAVRQQSFASAVALDELQDLEREDREDAGHQVEDEAAEEREDEREEREKTEERFRAQFRNLATEILGEQSLRFKETSRESIDILLKPFKENIVDFRKRVEEIYTTAAKAEGFRDIKGILQIRPDSSGIIHAHGYMKSNEDAFVPAYLIRSARLRTGDVIEGSLRPSRGGDKRAGLAKITTVNGMDPEQIRNRPKFGDLTPVYPNEPLRMEHGKDSITGRAIDIVSPIGKGQRGLIVSPPKAGKTTILKKICQSISINNPEVHLICLLVDERPEEVTDMQRSIKGEVVASTFDMPADNHTRVAELVIERAKRIVELGGDVVVVLDSITRLARAYNLAAPASGRILSGGVDSAALYPPKRFLGAARNIENGGSLTILASALIDTGSKMDEVIFEEFKGTGNMELKLDRDLADRRIFPAIDPVASGTRNEDLLVDEQMRPFVFGLRRILAGMNNTERAAASFIKGLKGTNTNQEFLVRSAKKHSDYEQTF